jgi:5-formyltetrahydrofolate cyclo-ligase
VTERLHPSPTDIIVDVIATPTALHRIARGAARPLGIKWELLSPEQIASTPPLQELKQKYGL